MTDAELIEKLYARAGIKRPAAKDDLARAIPQVAMVLGNDASPIINEFIEHDLLFHIGLIFLGKLK